MTLGRLDLPRQADRPRVVDNCMQLVWELVGWKQSWKVSTDCGRVCWSVCELEEGLVAWRPSTSWGSGSFFGGDASRVRFATAGARDLL